MNGKRFMSFRPRRSVLFLPGSNSRAIAKARTLPADVIIMDLEDAVAPDVKVDARLNVVKEIDSGGFGQREVAIRCNGLDTQWGKDDVRAIAKSKANAVSLLRGPLHRRLTMRRSSDCHPQGREQERRDRGTEVDLPGDEEGPPDMVHD
eukprot:767822-Hanusia_phi.AAC.2